MLVVGLGIAALVHRVVEHSAHPALDTFVLLSIPAAILSIVEVFGRECSVLKLSEVKPRFRGWKAWSQPFYMVAGKLARLGWKKESDVPRVEVSHAH